MKYCLVTPKKKIQKQTPLKPEKKILENNNNEENKKL